MQEQTPYNITPEQGWQKMAVILDEAMPVRKRRRPFVFWLTLAALGVIMTSGAVFIVSNMIDAASESQLRMQESPGIPPAKSSAPLNEEKTFESSEPMASHTESGNTSTANIQPDTHKQEHAKRNEDQSASTDEASKDLSQAADRIGVNARANNKTAFTSGKANSFTIPAQHDVAQVLTTSPSPDQAAQEGSAYDDVTNDHAHHLQVGVLSEKEYAGTAQRHPDQLEPLPTLSPTALILASHDIPEIAHGHLVEPRGHKTTIRPFMAGAGFAGFVDGSGLLAGAGALTSLTSAMRINAGISFQHFEPQSSFFSNIHRETTATPGGIVNQDNMHPSFDEYVLASEVGRQTAAIEIIPIVSRIERWQLHAGIDLDISRRFYVQGGGTIAFMSHAYSTYPIVTGDIYANPATVQVTHRLDEYDIFRKTITSLYGGIGWNATRNLSLYTQWHHSLTSYLVSDLQYSFNSEDVRRRDFVRGISAGLRYTL